VLTWVQSESLVSCAPLRMTKRHSEGAIPAVDVRIVESASELEALGDAWEELQKDAVVGSIFESHDFQHLWWRHYGRGRPLRVLAAFAAGKLVGVLALYVDTVSTLRYPVRALRLVGDGGDTSPDDLGPVLARSRETEVARVLARAVLALPDWDVLMLNDMNPDCPFAAEMAAAARAARLACKTGVSQKIKFAELPATWDAWLASLHRDRRYRVKNIRKKLNAAHPTRFFVWTDSATIDEGFDHLTRLHLKRWGTGTESFSSPEYLAFHRALVKACLGRDRLRLYCLELSGQMVAMYYFYKFRDRVYLMQAGLDPDYLPLKPGQVLLGYIFEHAIGEGHKVLDFLRGTHQYKDELASGERKTVFVAVFRNGPGGWVYRARRIILPALKTATLSAARKIRARAAKVRERG
jgi:CelD/BcsL family acetyltransferase involved in cellulose biosynthesis